MNPTSPPLPTLLENLVACGDPLCCAYGHNYLFEECVSTDRQKGYEEILNLSSAELRTWRDRHRDYLFRNVYVSRGRVPETFTALNANAQLRGLDTAQWVVRLERFDEVLDGLQIDLAAVADQLAALHGENGKRQAARAFLEEVCRHWNGEVRRQARPTFGAFFDDVEAEVIAGDWPNRLRNRLGLAHYHVPTGGQPIAIALMRYRVEDVLTATGGSEPEAFAVPTVLDSEINAHFFPAPRQIGFGRTLDLEPDGNCERLVSEILHRRIEYVPDHFLKVGWVTTPIPPHATGAALSRLRNGHLFCLRYESGLESFGMHIPEDGHG